MKRLSLLFALVFGILFSATVVADNHQPGTIVDVAAGNEDFSILVQAVQTAGLVETLSGEGPFTVFAPTNAAFEALLAELDITAEELLARDDLGAILTYHVVAGELMAADVLAAVESGGGEAMVETVNGASITVTTEMGNVYLNGDSQVVTTDIAASNGVIHVIDAVILPPADGGM